MKENSKARRYIVMILSMYKSGSGSKDDFDSAISMLPENLSAEDCAWAKSAIAEYLNIKEAGKKELGKIFSMLDEKEKEGQ